MLKEKQNKKIDKIFERTAERIGKIMFYEMLMAKHDVADAEKRFVKVERDLFD